MNKNENIFLKIACGDVSFTTYSLADFMIVKDMEDLYKSAKEVGELNTLVTDGEPLSENCLYRWDSIGCYWTKDFLDWEEELKMIKDFMFARDIKLIEQENDKTFNNKMVCNAKIGEPLNTKKGFKIIIELKTGDKFRTTDKPLTIKEVQEAIETFMKPNILGQKISNIDIQVVE